MPVTSFNVVIMWMFPLKSRHPDMEDKAEEVYESMGLKEYPVHPNATE